MQEDGSVHAGHRARMKERFLTAGLSSLSPHEIVEMLLFHTIPQKDVNELAHRLMERFGSVSRIIEANYDELRAVDGVGPNTATYFRFLCETFRFYAIETCEKPYVYDTIEKIGNYLVNFYLGVTVERAYAMLFDNQMRLIDTVLISEGTVNSVQLPMRVIVEKAIKRNASGIILAHNHPHGSAYPSDEDYTLTYSLEHSLDVIGITLIEHVIVSGKFFIPVLGARQKPLLSADNPANDSEHFYENFLPNQPIAAANPGAVVRYPDPE